MDNYNNLSKKVYKSKTFIRYSRYNKDNKK